MIERLMKFYDAIKDVLKFIFPKASEELIDIMALEMLDKYINSPKKRASQKRENKNKVGAK